MPNFTRIDKKISSDEELNIMELFTPEEIANMLANHSNSGDINISDKTKEIQEKGINADDINKFLKLLQPFRDDNFTSQLPISLSENENKLEKIMDEDYPEIELDDFEKKLFKDVSKEQLIRSRQHFQDDNVRLSNELFRANNRIKNLSIWINNELEITEVLYETEKEQYMKEIYAMQKVILKRILMELKNRKNEL